MGKVHYERVPLRRRYQEGGEVDPYDPLAASAGVAPAGTPRIDQIDWGQPSWAQQASEQSQRDQEAYAREGVRGVLRDTEGTQDLAGGFSDAGFAGTIKAYHGSPHSFERFDTSKIGTGEGNQTFGRGLYFAEEPRTAKSYRDDFANVTVGGRPYDPNDPVHLAVGLVNDLGSKEAAITDLRARAARDPGDFFERAIGFLEKPSKELPKYDVAGGHMYEVNINADPEHFLDWDKPLSEQHPKIRDALFSSGIVQKDIGQSGAAIAGQLIKTPEAAQALREAGVPGIKYLDQHSRWATDMKLGDVAPQTRNYVVFDDSLISIIKKYGLAGLIAGGAAHFTAPADDARGMARGGAAPADEEITLTPEEKDALIKWYHAHIEDRAFNGKTHYQMPPVAGMAPPGSFRIPKDVFEALGQGDLKLGGLIVHQMFGIEDSPERPDLIHPHAVRIIGNGSLAAGRKVLERFVARVRRQSREGVTLEHDGGDNADGHGWRVVVR